MEKQEKDPPSIRHRCARVEMFDNHSQDRGSGMQVTTYGVDLAKRVFQVHWVELGSGEVKRKMLMRGEFAAFFACRAAGLVAMEACASSHHWGRTLRALGHQVRLIPTQFVRPFVKSNKNDVADAQAIWEAAQRPEMRFVALKSEQQQAVLGLHRQRQLLVKMRTMQANQARGLLYEFGVVVPRSWRSLLAQAGPILAQDAHRQVPELIRGELQQQLQGLRALTERIGQLERAIASYRQQDEQCQRIERIPGVGPLSSTAVLATVGDARMFHSGRQFAAFLGLVPRQSGTGGRVRLLGISKRGDPYLRTLLIHGARAVVAHASGQGRTAPPWLQGLLSRRPKNVAIVAVANKIARTIWALLAHGRVFDQRWGQALPVSVD
jgi:transposase